MSDQRKAPPSSGPGFGPGRGGPGAMFGGVREKPKNAKKTIRRLLSYLSASRILVIFMIVVVILSTLANLSSNVLIKNLVAALGTFNIETGIFTTAPDPDAFSLTLLLLLLMYVSSAVLQYFSSLIGAYISNRMVRKMRNDLFTRIVHLPIKYVDTHAHGDLMSRMTNDVDNISMAVSNSLSSLISGILTLLGCLGIMIWYSPLLTTVSFIVLGITLLFTKFMSKYVRPLFSQQQALVGALNTQTEEMVVGKKTVTAYNRQKAATAEFDRRADTFTAVGLKAQIFGGSMGPVMNFIGNVGYFLVCVFGSLFIVKGIGGTLLGEPLTVAVVIMFLSTTRQFTRPINEIAMLYSSLATALSGAERVFAVMDEPVEDAQGTISFPKETVRGAIDFEHLNFGYVPDAPVLKDFSLSVRPGHRIALVGATGSGKTTIVNLLLRFYDPDSGTIKIDGKNISEISKDELRKAIAIVLQDPVLLSDTIANNVRYGNENATDADIDAALAFADCDSFVHQLPEGKETLLTEGATNLSQGQKQLLTIARAVVANPRILVLDEATSSVDTRTEKKIQDAMTRLMKNRTAIIIAHRLSTIRDADFIVVLDSGKIVESGNHQELLAIDGVYARLYRTQFRGLEI